MLTADITSWLDSNTTAGSRAYVVEHRAETQGWLDRIGIAPESEFAYFYLHYDASAARGWYELNAIDQIQDWTNYAHNELEVPSEYIALTGIEGDGMDLYNRNTQAVYVVGFGQFEQLAEGSLAPTATSFQGYLHWRKAKVRA